MSDQPPDLVLIILRRVEAKLDRVAEDMHDLKVRMTAVEEAVVGVHRRMDRLDSRVERIERRLDLVETP
jgi:predicted  nucleic acid-binding Zn-ribbon protein